MLATMGRFIMSDSIEVSLENVSPGLRCKTVNGYFVIGNQHLAAAFNVDDSADAHHFGIDPDVNNDAFIRAIGWTFPGA